MITGTLSSRGQVALPKEIREALNLKTGTRLNFIVEKGKIIIEPAITLNIPRSQAWFWDKEVQKDIRKAEENFKKGNFKRYEIDDFIKELEERDAKTDN